MSAALLLPGLFVLVAACLHGLSICVVAARARSTRTVAPLPAPAPGITILRPVCGLENNLERTLGSAFRLDHPRYEILFCVADQHDPVLPLLERLMTRHPGVPARILTGEDRVSINPKLNNLVKGWEAAAHRWIVMADSNVLMPPDYLQRLLSAWDERTGLVSSPPVGTEPQGFWAELECAFLNVFQARWQLAAAGVGLGFAQGKTMLWRRDLLDAAGGIRALAAEPAEDAAATKIVRAAGLRARLVPQPFPQPLGRRSLGEVWRRQLRWARLRRSSFRLFFWPEIMAGAFFPLVATVALAAAGVLPAWAPPGLAVLWYGAEAALIRAMGWPVSWRAPVAWILRDLMLPPLWVAAMCGSALRVARQRHEPCHAGGRGRYDAGVRLSARAPRRGAEPPRQAAP